MKTKFYYCPVCGNVIMKLADSGQTPHCCGREMWLMKPNSTDAAQEKHVPSLVRTETGALRVDIGSTPHPMTQEHYIQFVVAETQNGGQFRYFKPDQPASTQFCDCYDPATTVYAYCNQHGLWQNEEVPAKTKNSQTCCTSKCAK